MTTPPFRPSVPYALGAGRFSYNDSWFVANAQWNPGFPIEVNFPIEDQIYDLDTIGNFDATAGMYSSGLKWSSNVDGNLGSGGNIVVLGRLTEGEQDITVQLGDEPTFENGKMVEGQTPYGTQSRHITINARPSTLVAAPNPVPIPSGQMGFTTLSWNAPSYAAVDIGVVINGGFSVVAQGGSSGSTSVVIQSGLTYEFQLRNRGGNRSIKTVTVTSTGRGATISATPNPVVLAPGVVIGSTVVAWNVQAAPGVQIDLKVSVNDASETLVATEAQIDSVNIPWIGTDRYRFTIYEHGQSLPLAVTEVKGIYDLIFADHFD